MDVCNEVKPLTLSSVARIVHFLRLHLVGKKIANASAIDDANVFGKVGTSGAAVEAALKGRKVRESPDERCLQGANNHRLCQLAARASISGQ